MADPIVEAIRATYPTLLSLVEQPRDLFSQSNAFEMTFSDRAPVWFNIYSREAYDIVKDAPKTLAELPDHPVAKQVSDLLISKALAAIQQAEGEGR